MAAREWTMSSKMFDSDRISAIVDARLRAALWFSYPITGGLVAVTISGKPQIINHDRVRADQAHRCFRKRDRIAEGEAHA